MPEPLLRGRKPRYAFKCIEGGDAYCELKRIVSVPNHKLLTLRSIFEATEQDLEHVKDDIASIFEAVKNDINLENVQMEAVEVQLKKSTKKLNHTYDKICDNRMRNQHFTASSELISRLKDRTTKLSSDLEGIDDSTAQILENIVKIDARFPKNRRLLNGQVFNEQHYPLLFGLMRNKFGQLLEEDLEQSPKIPNYGTEAVQTANIENSPGNNNSEVESSSSNSPETVDDLIARYRMSQSVKASPMPVNDVYLPPSLRLATAPSTKTTFETISAKDIFKGPSLSGESAS